MRRLAYSLGRRFSSSSSGGRIPSSWKYAAAGGCAGVLGYVGGVGLGVLPAPWHPSTVADEGLASKSVTDRVFLKVQIGGEAVEDPIVIACYGVECPRTTANFVALCGSRSAAMGYRGVPVHRIIPGFMMQSGDCTRGDGTGGLSIYGGAFEDESFRHKHSAVGTVSMANRGPNTNTSQFFITFAATPWLDGRHVVFGRVVEGFDVIKRVEGVGSRTGAPATSVRIVECGCLRRTAEEEANAAAARRGD